MLRLCGYAPPSGLPALCPGGLFDSGRTRAGPASNCCRGDWPLFVSGGAACCTHCGRGLEPRAYPRAGPGSPRGLGRPSRSSTGSSGLDPAQPIYLQGWQPERVPFGYRCGSTGQGLDSACRCPSRRALRLPDCGFRGGRGAKGKSQGKGKEAHSSAVSLPAGRHDGADDLSCKQAGQPHWAAGAATRPAHGPAGASQSCFRKPGPASASVRGPSAFSAGAEESCSKPWRPAACEGSASCHGGPGRLGRHPGKRHWKWRAAHRARKLLGSCYGDPVAGPLSASQPDQPGQQRPTFGGTGRSKLFGQRLRWQGQAPAGAVGPLGKLRPGCQGKHAQTHGPHGPGSTRSVGVYALPRTEGRLCIPTNLGTPGVADGTGAGPLRSRPARGSQGRAEPHAPYARSSFSRSGRCNAGVAFNAPAGATSRTFSTSQCASGLELANVFAPGGPAVDYHCISLHQRVGDDSHPAVGGCQTFGGSACKASCKASAYSACSGRSRRSRFKPHSQAAASRPVGGPKGGGGKEVEGVSCQSAGIGCALRVSSPSGCVDSRAAAFPDAPAMPFQPVLPAPLCSLELPPEGPASCLSPVPRPTAQGRDVACSPPPQHNEPSAEFDATGLPPRPPLDFAPGNLVDELASEFSFCSWVSSLPRLLKAARTQFSHFLLSTLPLRRDSSSAVPTAFFPLPVPYPGLFTQQSCKPSGRAYLRQCQRKCLHHVVMALNYLRAGCKHVSLSDLQRPPSSAQVQAFTRLGVLIKACSRLTGAVPSCAGRRGPFTAARLNEVLDFMTRSGLGPGTYASSTLPGKGEYLPHAGGAPEVLRPYGPISAQQVVLHGRGQWDLAQHLDADTYMPYVEPEVLRFPGTFGPCPSFEKEDKREVLELCRIWDTHGILGLTKGPLPQRELTRVFGAYKAPGKQRQIGDRRGQNSREARLPGPSKWLPTGPLLTKIHVPRWSSCLVGSVTDRKDFYHQAKVSEPRSMTNAIGPLFRLGDFKG